MREKDLIGLLRFFAAIEPVLCGLKDFDRSYFHLSEAVKEVTRKRGVRCNTIRFANYIIIYTSSVTVFLMPHKVNKNRILHLYGTRRLVNVPLNIWRPI